MDKTTLVIIVVVIVVLALAGFFVVSRRDKAKKEAKGIRELTGIPISEQLTPPGGFTFEQQVEMGAN